jgi:excisionase family DNA binding protein
MSKTTREPAETPVMTAVEAAAYLRIGRSTLFALLKKRQIPSVMIAGRRFFLRHDLDAWLEDHREAAAA